MNNQEIIKALRHNPKFIDDASKIQEACNLARADERKGCGANKKTGEPCGNIGTLNFSLCSECQDYKGFVRGCEETKEKIIRKIKEHTDCVVMHNLGKHGGGEMTCLDSVLIELSCPKEKEE